MVLGILGGIASGKSFAARLLAGSDGLVLDADALAHEVLASDEVTALVAERFGPGALGADGRPDRAALARIVFADPEARRALEGWTHPRVRAMILARLEAARAADLPRVVLDVPLLLENDEQHGFVGLCDALIFVDADEEERERRAAQKRGWPPGELARRQAAQLPLPMKKQRADHVLANEGTAQELEDAVRGLLARLEPDAPPKD
ncbi:MAG: dephospho-CoA kinase [Planctomycetota bacterium]